MDKQKNYLFFLKIHEVQDDPSYQMVSEIIRENSEDVYYFDGEPCYLYAVTSEKRLAKEFRLMRNMNNFIMIKKKISREFSSDLILQESYYDYGNEAITFVTTRFEDESYNATFDYIDDELEDVGDQTYIMDEIIPMLKAPFQKSIINSGILNVVDFINRVETGEPTYLIMDFMKYMFRDFHFTFM